MERYILKSNLTFKAENLSEAREILELWFKQITDKKLSDLKKRILIETKEGGYVELVKISENGTPIMEQLSTIQRI